MRDETGDAEQAREDTRDTSRVEAFSDGVFGIAATLLVLDIRVPPHPETLDAWGMVGALGAQWPTYAAYVVSFVFILIMWINHHNMFRLIRRTDHNLLIFNGLLLLLVAAVPFPTSLLADTIQYDSGKTAAVVYNGAFLLIALIFNVLWRYASYKRRLLGSHVTQSIVDEINARYRFGPLLYFAFAVVGYFSPLVSLALNALLALYFARPGMASPIIRADPRTPPAS